MFKQLKLRWKILFALTALSVGPLLACLFLVSGLTESLLRRDMALIASKTEAFVERSLAAGGRESSNYAALLSGNADLVNGVYFATLTGETEQLSELILGARARYGFDLVEIRDAGGNLLVRQLREGLDLPPENSADHPALQGSLQGEVSSAIGPFSGQLCLVAAAPVKLRDQAVGHLVGATLLNDRFATELKELGGAEIAFFDGSRVVAHSHPALAALDPASLPLGEAGIHPLGEVPHRLFRKPLTTEGQGMLLALDSSQEVESRRSIRRTLGLLVALVTVLALGTGLAFSRGLLLPLGAVVRNLKEIAEGEGDLTRTLPVSSGDEVGELAGSFNRFLGRLQEMVGRTRRVSGDVLKASDRIRTSSREVHEGAARQSHALEESFRALQGIDGATSQVAEHIDALLGSAQEASSATLQLGASTAEIAEQAEGLFGAVDEVSSSIAEMSVSSQQITENIGILASSTDVTASSILELDAAIKEIEENAGRTSRLSEEAARDAESGKEAVDATIEGIGAIRETVDRASAAMQELGSQSQAIGRILNVIDEVADQTGLLSLNAAIIAAQAGEHGKGFAVVADEIRQLADRTADSTREIAGIIKNLQRGTEEAVTAMTAGSQRVHQEVERSRSTGAALEKIRGSTTKATEEVRGIVRATQEQARGSRMITESINRVSEMLGQIAAAIRQQTDGTRQLANASEAMRGIASHVKGSAGEQALGSRQIARNMEEVRQMLERISEATREQTLRSRQVVSAVSEIRAIAESNAGRTVELDQVVEELCAQAAALEKETGAFRT